MSRVPISRALISVYDKAGLEDLASGLHAAGAEIVSTGSTAARIAAAGVPVTPVEQLTGFPECLDGRVKTLHPRVHAGLLADTNEPRHEAELAGLGIEPFQLLVSNLYPFEATVASGASAADCVEQIDIGGPAMIRAAAKNHGSVAVITDPSRYPDVLAAVAAGGFTVEQRRALAAEAFARTAAYDIAVASWFSSAYAPDEVARDSGWPRVAGALWQRSDVLRYGENPHQRAALYTRSGPAEGIASAELLHGKAMSYNNYVDADAARRAAFDFAEPCVAIIKHSNPCGIAVGADLAQAHARAHACDPTSAFGGVIAANGAGHRGPGPADRRRLHRGGHRPRLRGGGAGHPVRQQERPAAALRAAGRRGRPGVPPGQRGNAAAVRGPGRRAGRRSGALGAQGGPGGRPGDAGRPGLRLEGVPLGQVQRHPARLRRRLRRHRHGPGQPGGLGPAGRAAGRATGPRARSPPATRTSPSPTASRSWPRPGSARWPSRAARSATT